jgi:hypothetical protein
LFREEGYAAVVREYVTGGVSVADGEDSVNQFCCLDVHA